MSTIPRVESKVRDLDNSKKTDSLSQPTIDSAISQIQQNGDQAAMVTASQLSFSSLARSRAQSHDSSASDSEFSDYEMVEVDEEELEEFKQDDKPLDKNLVSSSYKTFLTTISGYTPSSLTIGPSSEISSASKPEKTKKQQKRMRQRERIKTMKAQLAELKGEKSK